MHTSSLRAAILTSLGLMPLGCIADRVDGAPVADIEDTTDTTGTTDTPGATDTPHAIDRPDASEPDGELSSCGASMPLPAVLTPFNVYDSSPVLDRSIQSGIHGCENGVRHRPTPVTCASGLPRPLPPESDAGAVSQVQFLYPDVRAVGVRCAADTDCVEHPHGYCAPGYQGGPGPYDIKCKYGCLQDADCGEGGFCECGDPVGHCVESTCKSDQDCGADLLCAAWFTPVVCAGAQFYTCQTAEDECRTAADCGDGYCSGEGGVRKCVSGPSAVCGRPFLVEGEARLAAVSHRTDWASANERWELAPPEADAAPLALVGEYWLGAALMEHASIAAFARFTLQLLHLGAPCELVEQSQRAMIDETEHAKSCFALASRYLGRPVGPGPLPMDAALAHTDLESVVLMAFLEGCVGETVATLEARAALDVAVDGQVRSALGRIVRDEQRHAELAWCFVRWALSVGGQRLGSALARETERLQAELAEPSQSAAPAGSREHGVLSTRERAQVRRAALAEVVLPCARALLDVHSGLKIPSRAACQITATEG